MLNIGVRTHDFAKGSIEEIANIISEKGFGSIQLALKKSIEGFEGKKGEITAGFANNIRKKLDKKDIRIAVLGCYINMGHKGLEMGKLSDYFKEHIKYARDFGCTIIGTETGSLNGDYSFNEGNHSEEALEHFIENLKPLVEEAEKFGVIVGIEAVTKHIVNTPERMKYVLDKINSNNLQVIFDPVNLLDENNYENQEKIVDKSFELFGDKIAIIHSKDFVIESGKIKTVYTGKGLFNYKHLIKKLKIEKPNIDILLENAIPEKSLEIVEFLNGLYKEV